MLLIRKQRIAKANKSQVLTLPRPWLESENIDGKKPVTVIGLSALIVLPQRVLSRQEVESMCSDLVKLVPIAQGESHES